MVWLIWMVFTRFHALSWKFLLHYLSSVNRREVYLHSILYHALTWKRLIAWCAVTFIIGLMFNSIFPFLTWAWYSRVNVQLSTAEVCQGCMRSFSYTEEQSQMQGTGKHIFWRHWFFCFQLNLCTHKSCETVCFVDNMDGCILHIQVLICKSNWKAELS